MAVKYTPDKSSGVINQNKVSDPALFIGHYGFEIIDKPKGVITCKYPAFRLHFVVKGKVFLSYGGKTVTLAKNSLFVLIPNADTNYCTDETVATEIYWVTFNGYNALKYTNLIGLSESKPFMLLKNGTIIKYFYDNFVKQYDDSPVLELVLQKNLFNILHTAYEANTEITQRQNNEPKNKETEKTNKFNIQNILLYIQQHLSDPELSLKSMAEALYFHPNYVSRMFRQEMSLTFSRYLAMRRIEYSVSLIEQGYTNVSTISSMCGFKDPLYFSRVFKKIECVAPTSVIAKQKATPPQETNLANSLQPKELQNSGVNITTAQKTTDSKNTRHKHYNCPKNN